MEAHNVFPHPQRRSPLLLKCHRMGGKTQETPLPARVSTRNWSLELLVQNGFLEDICHVVSPLLIQGFLKHLSDAGFLIHHVSLSHSGDICFNVYLFIYSFVLIFLVRDIFPYIQVCLRSNTPGSPDHPLYEAFS